MAEALVKVEIKRVIGPTSTGAAVLLGNDTKTFVIFIGFHEAAALLREINDETAIRPLTHDLLQSVLLGFDVVIKKIVVTRIVDNAFCATLILEQASAKGLSKSGDEPGDESTKSAHPAVDPSAEIGHRTEVRIDARPSDCFVLAKKNQAELYVTQAVFDQVQDFSGLAEQDELELGSLLEPGGKSSPFVSEELLSLPEDFLRRSTQGAEPEEPVSAEDVGDASDADASDPDASDPDANDPDANDPDANDPDASDPDSSDPDAHEKDRDPK